MTTRWDMVEAGISACENGVQYIYGAKPVGREWRRYSLDEIRALRSVYGAYVWETDDFKAGSYCCDCSGLLAKATGIVRGSSQFLAAATEIVSLETLSADWDRHVGWGLWMPGHIGIVSDVEGYYYAMDGSARNAVHYPMGLQDWVSCIRIADVDYEDTGGTAMNLPWMIYQPDGEPRLDWYDGTTIHTLPCPDNVTAVQKAYTTLTGQKMPEPFRFGDERNPWAARFAQAVHAGERPLQTSFDENAVADFSAIIEAIGEVAG